jgi:hypothetical protein
LAVDHYAADRRSPSPHWLLVLSLIVFTAIVSACSVSNEPNGSSSADTTVGSDTTSPSSTGAGIGSNLLWAVAYGNEGFIVVGN